MRIKSTFRHLDAMRDVFYTAITRLSDDSSYDDAEFVYGQLGKDLCNEYDLLVEEFPHLQPYLKSVELVCNALSSNLSRTIEKAEGQYKLYLQVLEKSILGVEQELKKRSLDFQKNMAAKLNAIYQKLSVIATGYSPSELGSRDVTKFEEVYNSVIQLKDEYNIPEKLAGFTVGWNRVQAYLLEVIQSVKDLNYEIEKGLRTSAQISEKNASTKAQQALNWIEKCAEIIKASPDIFAPKAKSFFKSIKSRDVLAELYGILNGIENMMSKDVDMLLGVRDYELKRTDKGWSNSYISYDEREKTKQRDPMFFNKDNERISESIYGYTEDIRRVLGLSVLNDLSKNKHADAKKLRQFIGELEKANLLIRKALATYKDNFSNYTYDIAPLHISDISKKLGDMLVPALNAIRNARIISKDVMPLGINEKLTENILDPRERVSRQSRHSTDIKPYGETEEGRFGTGTPYRN